MGLRREYVVNKLKPIDKNFKSESTPKEVIEEVIEEVVQTPPEPIDEVTEVSDEEVVVEIEVMNTDENMNNTIYSEEALKEVVEEVEEEKPVKVKDVKTEEYLKVLEEEKDKKDEDKKVICLDTLDVYINAKDAESKTPAKAGAITRNCNGNSKRAGGLRWMYYLDYLKEN